MKAEAEAEAGAGAGATAEAARREMVETAAVATAATAAAAGSGDGHLTSPITTATLLTQAHERHTNSLPAERAPPASALRSHRDSASLRCCTAV